MGNWQERIRQALGPEEKKLKSQQDAERLRAQQKKEGQLEAIRLEQEKTETVKIQLLSILERIDARSLLQQIKEEVWKVGVVDSVPSFREYKDWGKKIPCVFLGLRFQYKTAVERTKFTNEPPGGRGGEPFHYFGGGTGEFYVGTEETSLVAKVYRVPSNNQIMLSVDRGSFPTSSIWSMGYLGSTTPSKKSLEEFLLRDCIDRSRFQSLPLQLQAQGKDKIARLVPLRNRLFR